MGLFDLFGNKNIKKYHKLKEISKDIEVLEGIEFRFRTGMLVSLNIVQKVSIAIKLINEISSSTGILDSNILDALSDENMETILLSKIS